MTLVSDSPHVASLLRINISKFGYALQAFFILRYSPHVASLLRINISKLGCALQAYLTKSIHRFTAFSLTGKTASIALRFVCVLLANFISRYSPHVASLLRINISKFSCDFQANFMLRYSPHVASLLRINISKFGCALQANFIYAIALTSLRSSGSISLSSVAPYRLISFTL